MKVTIALSAPMLFLASFAAATTLNQVNLAIIAIDNAVGELYKVTHVQSIGYIGGIHIRDAAGDLTSKIQAGAQCVHDLHETPTDKDAELMLWTLGKTEGKVEQVVDDMIRLKPQFQELGVLSIAQSSVTAFQGETKAFASQLVKLAPGKEQSAATALAGKFNTALAKCEAAYNGKPSTGASTGKQSAPVSGAAQQGGAQQGGAQQGGAQQEGAQQEGAQQGGARHGTGERLVKRKMHHGHHA